MKTETTQREAVILHRLLRWFCCNVAFVSWSKHWKGIYLHFFPRYCVRIFLWGVDWRRKNPLIYSPNVQDQAQARREQPMQAGEAHCGCRKCNPDAWWMVVCDLCGNKRCPHATDHRHECTRSNEPGQAGSVFGPNEKHLP